MARRRASEFLLACERGHSALFQSLDFFPSSGLYTYGKAATQLSKQSSVFQRGLESWKCCFRPSYFWATQKHKTFELNKSGSFHHRLFSSTGTHTKRNPSFSTLNPDDVRYFKEILGNKNVIQDEDRLLDANIDWMRKYKGSSQLLLLPRNTEEVSKILKYCNCRCLPVVPQGGNTGLVGGSVPVYDEVIINLSSMDNIISLDKISGILVCEAGCILEHLNSFLANEGYVMPLDLGAKGSCQIGGNVSTNAGGLHFIRYGSLHENILGLEVTLADGTILDMLTTLRKDNTGYDLKHLFIGNEGTLGIITKVAVLTPCKLSSTNTAFLSCNDFLSCQKLLGEAKRNLGETLSAFEFMDHSSVELALTYIDGTRNPLPASLGNFYVLVETIGTEESYDR